MEGASAAKGVLGPLIESGHSLEYEEARFRTFDVPARVRANVCENRERGAILNPEGEPQVFSLDGHYAPVEHAVKDERRTFSSLALVRPNSTVRLDLLDP